MQYVQVLSIKIHIEYLGASLQIFVLGNRISKLMALSIEVDLMDHVRASFSSLCKYYEWCPYYSLVLSNL